MTIFLSLLIPASLLIILGVALVWAPTRAEIFLKSLPRSRPAAIVCFGSAAIWFLIRIWTLSLADFGDKHVFLFFAFGGVGILAFKFAPEFLAVRGLCALMILSASPLLEAGFLNFETHGLLLQRILVYIGIVLALWLASQPWRLRDFLEWLFSGSRRPGYAGWIMLVYGSILLGVAQAVFRAGRHS